MLNEADAGFGLFADAGFGLVAGEFSGVGTSCPPNATACGGVGVDHGKNGDAPAAAREIPSFWKTRAASALGQGRKR